MKLINGRYQVQEVDLLTLCQTYDTALYVYDADIILGQYLKLKQAFMGMRNRIMYAAKALSNVSILSLLKQAGAGLDAVSIQEVRLGLLSGFTPDNILFTPNGVNIQEIKEAVELGVHINIDNINALEQFGSLYRNNVPCCVRINPHIVAGGNTKIQVGHIDSKFGISIFHLRHLLRVVKSYDIKVNGLHVHTGSDILDPEVFVKSAEVIFEAAGEFPDLEFIDLGSGFKVPYKTEDAFTDVYELGVQMASAFKQFCSQYGRELEVWFEPGKFLVSEAGLLLVKVNQLKQTPGTAFVSVDSGQNHLVRPMMYGAYHDIVNISNPEGQLKLYSVVGYICETDTFGADRKLNEVREGDILAIKNAGAYGFSMSSQYNSRPRPAEVLIYQGQPHLIRRRETLEDLLQTQTNIFSTQSVYQ
ncbi:MAG: diaminopimelate decarboxylase [Cytophagales bacterium]|nr:MAG: diaminopimelate decarboxylase [Cytophagales bacterium]TAF61551.1 MAG: diaminopimelate decarboxylase [Cytophagales bacterium]